MSWRIGGFFALQFGQDRPTAPFTDRALREQLLSWGVLVLESHHGPEFAMERRPHPLINGRGTFARDYAVGKSPGYYAFVTKRSKFIAPFEYQKDGKIVLFDWKKNPAETVNIADQNPELVERFRRKADVWLAKSGQVLVQPGKERSRAVYLFS